MVINSNESGNDAFHIFEDNDNVAVLPVRWSDCDDIARLLDISDRKHPGILMLDSPSDPRKFIVLYNKNYNVHYPTVVILKYTENNSGRTIVDVDQNSDMDIVKFVRKELC